MLIHCAAHSDPHKNDVFLNNVSLTKKLLETVKCDHFVFLSTGLVYGDCIWEKHEGEPLSPQSEYALSKQVCENLVSYYAKQNGFKHTILRLAPILGQGITHGIVYDLQHKTPPITVKGTNSGSIRSYVHIEDLVEIIKLIISDQKQYIINIGNEDYITTGELVQMLHPGAPMNWTNEAKCTNKLFMNTDRLKSFYELKYTSKQTVNAYITNTKPTRI